MSRQRASRNRRRAAEGSSPSTPPRAPRASRIGTAFALFLGLFLGRVFSDNFSAETLGLIDLGIFAGLAATIALAFRRWARRTIEDRERLRRRRQRTDASAASTPDETHAHDHSR